MSNMLQFAKHFRTYPCWIYSYLQWKCNTCSL